MCIPSQSLPFYSFCLIKVFNFFSLYILQSPFSSFFYYRIRSQRNLKLWEPENRNSTLDRTVTKLVFTEVYNESQGTPCVMDGNYWWGNHIYSYGLFLRLRLQDLLTLIVLPRLVLFGFPPLSVNISSDASFVVVSNTQRPCPLGVWLS